MALPLQSLYHTTTKTTGISHVLKFYLGFVVFAVC
mgnify:CR=1 FL=1